MSWILAERTVFGCYRDRRHTVHGLGREGVQTTGYPWIMSEDAKLACKVLAGLPSKRRVYSVLMETLSQRFTATKYEEGDSRRARAVRALMECMDEGVIQRVNGKLMTLDEVREQMGGGFSE